MGSHRVEVDGISTEEQDCLDPGEGRESGGDPINRHGRSGEKALHSGSEFPVSAA